MSRHYVYRAGDDLEGTDLEGLEVLVTLYDDPAEDPAPEVALRPTIDGHALRVWGPPLELRQRDDERAAT